jgi:hypothetical protein
MFVRWKRRAALERVYKPERGCYWRSEPTGTWIKTAYLIRAIRTPLGPRQEYVCRLGSFTEGREGDPEEQDRFWLEAELKVLAHADPVDEEWIIATLAGVIPKPET